MVLTTIGGAGSQAKAIRSRTDPRKSSAHTHHFDHNVDAGCKSNFVVGFGASIIQTARHRRPTFRHWTRCVRPTLLTPGLMTCQFMKEPGVISFERTGKPGAIRRLQTLTPPLWKTFARHGHQNTCDAFEDVDTG